MKTYRDVAWKKCGDAIAEALDCNPWEYDGSDRGRALNEFEIKLNAAIDAVPAVAEILDRPHRNPSKLPTAEDYRRVDQNYHNALAALIDTVHSEHPDGRPAEYSRPVYEAALAMVNAFKAGAAVHNYRITDMDEYNAEIERRRQIGLTIDPATAETTFWWADVFDPYAILDPKHHGGQSGRERFARHPGASNDAWVDFHDLPEATREALWARDRRKLSFPYGLNPGDDIINRPPGDDRNDMPANKLPPTPANKIPAALEEF